MVCQHKMKNHLSKLRYNVEVFGGKKESKWEINGYESFLFQKKTVKRWTQKIFHVTSQQRVIVA